MKLKDIYRPVEAWMEGGAGPEVQQAPIRLKNLLRQATQALQAGGVRAPMIQALLAPLRRLARSAPTRY